MRMHSLFAALAAVSSCLFAVPAARAAEDPASFPSRTIRLISPFAPGGGTDTVARLLAEGLTRSLGQTVVVENKAGAGGAIGTQFVAKSAPDGYTLLLGNFGIFSVLPNLTKAPYHPLNDFAPVTQTTNSATILVVNPRLQVKTVKELVDLAKRNPGKLSYGSSSSSPMIVMELFKQMTGTHMVSIPYKGTGPVLTAMLAGEVDVMFGGAINTLPAVSQGKLRALATAGSKRTQALPDVPTVAEAGVPGFAADSWNGVFAPKGTPPVIVRRLSQEIVKLLQTPEIRKVMETDGAVPVGTTPEQFEAFVKADVERWAKVVQASGIKAQQ